ncbi:hypothetical protein JTE90_029234 [Oedothorax gibbosus]|uniref:Uncharacterized protein n=1 Tax=Oedothorax gibbosus TaxID=931172 RepID=A0AAV6VCL6_9ARAC|nr:hypothetical protein JTE90_029234 [Oedothorax gibbosus]
MTEADFVHRLRSQMRLLRPAAVTCYASQKTFVHKDLLRTSHVFIRTDAVRRPLEHPYKGPFKVKSRSDKFFTLDINERQDTVSLDRLKPAFILYEDDSPQYTSRATTVPSTSTVPKASTSTAPKASTSTVPTKLMNVLNISSLGNSRLRNSSLGYSSLGDSRLGQSRPGDSRRRHNRLGHSRVGYSRLGDSRLGDSSLGYSSLVYSSLGYSYFIYRANNDIILEN